MAYESTQKPARGLADSAERLAAAEERAVVAEREARALRLVEMALRKENEVLAEQLAGLRSLKTSPLATLLGRRVTDVARRAGRAILPRPVRAQINRALRRG